MSPDAGTLELVELDMRLDFEHTPKCTASTCDGQTAKWIGTASCCGDLFYACNRHHDQDVRFAAFWKEWSCRFCDGLNGDFTWKPIA